MQDEESLTMLIEEMKACQQESKEERMKVKVQRYALALHRPDVYLRDTVAEGCVPEDAMVLTRQLTRLSGAAGV